MGFEGSGGNGNGNGKLLGMRTTPSQMHKRSKSFPDKKTVEEDEVDCSVKESNRVKVDKGCSKGFLNMEPHNSLKQEILQLEKRLQDQFQVRRALEKALGYRFSPAGETTEVATARPATKLIREISVLELEVVNLEQYLLSLYRKAFDAQLFSKSPSSTPRGGTLEVPRPDILSKREKPEDQPGFKAEENLWTESKEIGEEKPLDSYVQRCHSSLSHCSGSPTRFSPPAEGVPKSLHSYHFEPLSTIEYAHNDSCNAISLAEHLGTRISDHVMETPNRLSEDMVKCMASIYCKLADPPFPNQCLSSPNSSVSTGGFSPQDQCDMWSPRFKNYSSFDVRLDNPFHVEGLKEFSGPYSMMVEVTSISRDKKKFGDIEILLQNFRSLVSKLEEVDPRELNRGEKIAFWINIHNSLVMHAYLAHGIPQNNLKRLFLLSKAAYNVGGHATSAEKMQSSILGCRMSLPGQWVRLLFPKTKFKLSDERQAYRIDRPEPRLHFALCTGTHSDPALRVYTPKRIFQELENAKEEYFRATFGIRKDRKVVLPKMVESYRKECGLCAQGLMEMIQKSLPESVGKRLEVNQLGNSGKNIEWVPHNFAFRFLISKELVK